MLPFLSKKKDHGIASGVIVKTREPDKTEENQEDDKDAAIHACANDLINAVHSKDTKGVAEAMRSAFEILEKMPHEEIEHENEVSPHTYESQRE